MEETKWITTIERLKESSEETYLAISNTFSTLVDHSRISLKMFQRVDSKNIHAASGEIRLLNQFSILTKKFAKPLNSSVDRVEEFLASLQDFLGIESSLETIKDSSQLIAIFSLNALVSAVKAGKQGGGFSYITQELKSLSEKTIDKTDEMYAIECKVKEYHETLLPQIDHLKSLESSLNHFISQEEESSRQAAFSNLGKLHENLDKVSTSGERLMGHFGTVMHTIQTGDFVRQAFERLAVALKFIEKERAAEESSVETIWGIHYLVQQCYTLICDLKEKLHRDNSTMKESITKTEEILELIGEQGDLIGKSDDLNSISGKLKSLQSSIGTFSEESGKVKNIQNDISLVVKDISGTSQQLIGILESLKKNAELFKNINLFSRIEVAKNSVLAHMKVMLKDMAFHIDKIDSCNAIFEGSLNTFSAKIDELSSSQSSSEMEFSIITDEYIPLMQQLNRRLSSTIGELELVTANSVKLKERVAPLVEKLEESLSHFDQLFIPLGRLEEAFEEEAKSWEEEVSRLKEAGESVTIDNLSPHFKTIISDVTSFTSRETVIKENLETENEKVLDESSVILF